jgi:hypothetical protein
MSLPSQVTGWPIRTNSPSGQPRTASSVIATTIAPAKPTRYLRLDLLLMRKTVVGRKPICLDFCFVFAGDWWLLLASVVDLTFDSV